MLHGPLPSVGDHIRLLEKTGVLDPLFVDFPVMDEDDIAWLLLLKDLATTDVVRIHEGNKRLLRAVVRSTRRYE